MSDDTTDDNEPKTTIAGADPDADAPVVAAAAQTRDSETSVAEKGAEAVETAVDAPPVEPEPEPEPEPDPNAVTVTIDGREVAARKGEMLITAAERNGTYIPRFCFHSRLSPVGMCRQCIVEVDTGRGPGLQPSCMVPVSDNMVVDTKSDTVQRAQQGIIELLLANHPLDCPVCDKGGECPLQDQAFSHGPGESRFVEEKRHYEKPIPLSDHILLDRERCILCDRCTRFADEVAGDKLIHFIDRGNYTQVNTFPDEPFASYFSGNVAQICPVGALTAKPYRFKARPWDLSEVESTCTTCSVGCRVSVHTSRDQVLRVQGVDADSVNWGWLCDRGRFNFEAIDADDRLTEPLIRTADGLVPTQWTSAMAVAGDVLKAAVDNGTIAVLGGARSTNEGAFAWSRLCEAAGVDYRDAQLGDGLPAEVLGIPRATIDSTCAAATVILLGPDLKEELPVLYLRLRHAAESGATKLIELSPTPTGLTRYAWRSERFMPGAFAQVASSVFDDPDVAAQLATGDVVVVAGRSNLAQSAQQSAADLSRVLERVPDATVLPTLRRGNVIGALQVGMAPRDADHDGIAALEAAANGKVDVLILVGCDPMTDCPDHDLARRALASAGRVISVDTFLSASSAHADIVFPVAGFAEEAGTTTNIEGRVSVVAQAVTPAGTARTDWMVASELALLLDHDLGFAGVDDITAAIAGLPGYDALDITELGTEGVLSSIQTAALSVDLPDDQTPNSYDYRLIVNRKMYDSAASTARSPSLAGLAPGASLAIHPHDLDRVGVPSGTEVEVISEFGSTVLPLVSDDRVTRGTVVAGWNQPGTGSIGDVISATTANVDVKIERTGGTS